MGDQAGLYRVSAKAVLLDPSGRVLLLRSRGRWEFPGGGVRPGESLFVALQREVAEETGISIPVITELVAVEQWTCDGVDAVGVFYLCQCPRPTGEVTISREHTAYRWVDPNDLPHELVLTPDTAHAISALWAIQQTHALLNRARDEWGGNHG